VQFLLEKGANAEKPYCRGQSVLMYAVQLEEEKYDDEMIDTLVRCGVDVNGKLESGPIHIAVAEGNLQAVEKLIRLGVELDARDSNYGLTPLFYALLYEQYKCLAWLIMHGANVNTQIHDGRTPLHHAVAILAKAGDNANIKQLLNIAHMLLAKGANKNTVTNKGNTPLHLLCNYPISHTLDIPTFNSLLHDLIPNEGLEVKNEDGKTPLFVAAAQGNLHMMKKLLEMGANEEAKDGEGRSPLMAARENNENETAEELEKWMAKKNCSV
jgi:ankyrin repeat protein